MYDPENTTVILHDYFCMRENNLVNLIHCCCNCIHEFVTMETNTNKWVGLISVICKRNANTSQTLAKAVNNVLLG